MYYITSTTIFGFSLDVYIIVAILGTPIFFIWKRILKKNSGSKRKRIIITWLVTIFSTPIVYTVIVTIWFLISIYYPNRNFSKAEWDNNKDERYEFAHDIINSKMLIGKTKADIKKLLGGEGNKDDDSDWFYDLGFTPGSIDPDTMELEFKNGKVEDVVRREHH
jgi:hypothetical protein